MKLSIYYFLFSIHIMRINEIFPLPFEPPWEDEDE